tara:strand:- start:3385 stop:4938 length:1554 start_codon:yes stop_codon:yes gene_type:complete
MKFIRLVSEESNGVLDNEFNSDVKLEPKAQIAYRSLAVDIDPQLFAVDASNNGISFQSSIADGLSKLSGSLPIRSYTTDNAKELLTDLQNLLNRLIAVNSKGIGHQFQVVIKGGKTRVETQFCPNSVQIFRNNFSGDFGISKNNLITNSGTISQTSGAGTDTDNNIGVSFQEFGKGTAVWRIRVKRHTDNAGASNTNGFEFGLTNIEPSGLVSGANPINLTDAQKFYNFKAQKVGDNYRVNKGDGVFDVDTGIAPNVVGDDNINNDIIEFRKDDKFIRCILYRSNQANPDFLFSDDLTVRFATGVNDDPLRTGINQPLYPYLIMHGDDANAQLDGGYVRCFFDPFRANITALGDESEMIESFNHGTLGARPSDAKPNRQTTSELTFDSLELAEYMGFDRNVLRSEDTLRRNYLVHSKNNFTASQTYDNLVVELMNLQLESFDGLSKGRRNILATIPAIKNSDGVIVNEASNLIFIDLDNANPISLRNIKARLLYGDLTEPQTTGLTSLSLIFKNKGE